MSWMCGLSCEALEYYLSGEGGELAAVEAHEELLRRLRERETVEEMIERLEALGYVVLSPEEVSCDMHPWRGALIGHRAMSEDRMCHMALEAVRGATRLQGLDPLGLRPDEALQVLDGMAHSQDTCITRWYCQCTDQQLGHFAQAWGQWQADAADRESALASGQASKMLSWARAALR
jgi:hypothetical protein